MKIVSIIFFSICLLVAAYFIIGLGTIIKNGTSITDSPGSLARLKLFFSTNSAETTESSPFPELQPKRYPMHIADVALLQEKITISAESLGYVLDTTQSNEQTLHFHITTPLFKFVDDLRVSVSQDSENLVVHATSKSRTGRADFGANVANIRNFFAVLDKSLKQKN